MTDKKPTRKRVRMKGYDYSNPGAYFITICAKSRQQILGRIVGCGDFDAPKMVLSEYGKTADKYIHLMQEKYEHIKIDKYVIMPNHIHMIIKITYKSGASETAAPYNSILSKFVSLFKRYCNRECKIPIFQRSFHDHIIRGEKDYKKIWEYIDTKVQRWKFDCLYTKEITQ